MYSSLLRVPHRTLIRRDIDRDGGNDSEKVQPRIGQITETKSGPTAIDFGR